MEDIEKIQCPVCNMPFRDKRGLTSHARNKHELGRHELHELVACKKQKEDKQKLLAGFGAILLALLSLGNLK